MKSFYEFYRLIQERKLWEQEMGDPMAAGGQVGAPPMQGGMPPGGMPMNAPPAQGMPAGMPDAGQGQPQGGVPQPGQEGAEDDSMSNVAPSEGEFDLSNVDQALEAIAGMVDNFKSMDEEKGTQIEELVGQLNSLIKSVTGQEEEGAEGQEGAEGEEGMPDAGNGMSPIPPGGAGLEGGAGAPDLGAMGGMPGSPAAGTSQMGAEGMGGMGMAGGAAGMGGPPMG